MFNLRLSVTVNFATMPFEEVALHIVYKMQTHCRSKAQIGMSMSVLSYHWVVSVLTEVFRTTKL